MKDVSAKTIVSSVDITKKVKDRVLIELEAISNDYTDYETASRNLVHQIIKQELGEHSEHAVGLSVSDLMQSISDDLFGLGRIEEFLRDNEITDIHIEDTKALLSYSNQRAQVKECFSDVEEVRRIIDRITGLTGKRVDAATPFCDCRLNDGSRCHIIVPPAADRFYVTIRKHKCLDLTIDDWVDTGIMPARVAEILESAVRSKKNILISGGTGAGKTTLLNTLAKLIHRDQIVVTLEDTYELNTNMPHVRRLLTRDKCADGVERISYSQLLKNALRMNPDRLILGEVRDNAAYDLLHALNIGHKGSISTLHANSAEDALWRLENLAMLGAPNLQLSAIRRQVARVIDLVVQLNGNTFEAGVYTNRQFVEIAKIQSQLVSNGDYDLDLVYKKEASHCY